MRLQGFLLITVGMIVGSARADDRAAARALIEEAIRAHGGEAALAKWPVVTVKTEGIFHGYERTPVFFFTCEETMHGAEQFRSVLDGKITVPNGKPNPQKFRVVNVLDGQRGWIKMSGEGKQDTQECTPAQLLEFQHSGYVNWLAMLLPLKGAGFTLTLTDEEKDHGRNLVGVRLSSRGRRDVTLFFDKETRLLVKTETRATAGTDVEGKVVTVLSRHKEFQGVQRPTMWAVYYNDRSLISHWVLDYRLSEQAESGTFEKP
jgi:hypothetical protein